jgi:hypothetical protein
LPALVFWHSGEGRRVALCLFFMACCSLVAHAFRRESNGLGSDEWERPERVWRERLMAVGGALLSASVVFSVFSLTLNDPHDLVAVFFAFVIPIPAMCIVPYLTLATRKPFAAVVFTVFLMFCMKLAGCTVVVLVYGWNAVEHGHTTMPWTHPNLLVWLFFLNSSVLSLTFYLLGKSRFRREMTVPRDTSLQPTAAAPIN